MSKVSKTPAPPTEYSEEVFDTILLRLADGESLNRICRDKDMPGRSNVYMWIINDDRLRDKYVRAREIQAEVLVDEIMDIADDATNDYVTETRDDGSTYQVVDHDHIQRTRVRIDARKWYAGKVKPKKYGESATLDVGEGVTIKVRHTFPEPDGPETIEGEAVEIEADSDDD